MKQITKWIANDGKEFTYEEDCYEYEATLKCGVLTENDIKVWDATGKLIELLPNTIDEIDYVEFFTEKGWEVFNEMCTEQGYDGVDGWFGYNPGLYYYGEEGRWRSWTQEYLDLIAIRSKLKK